ncbi:MAG: DNA alkylation repair protein [Actinomycetota bacterium]
MAAPLKDSFGPEVAEYIAELLGAVADDFPTDAFLDLCLDGYDELELRPRAQHIADALAEVLPTDGNTAVQLIVDALRHEGEPQDLHGMEAFRYLPLSDFVGEHGLGHFDVSMVALREITMRFSAEFAIRPFLEQHTAATLDQCRAWTADESEHVRRLVSEGTRPRLPWAPRLRMFMADPHPVVELLELLKDDDSEYVRRSVANCVNDIAKDHPDVAVDIARRWWPGASVERQRLVKHALRSLIKQGDVSALEVIGYGGDSPLVTVASGCEPATVPIGSSTHLWVDLHNPTDHQLGALVDFRVHFVKANGSTSPKVFKGAEIDVAPGATATVRKKVSLKVHTTRTPYTGSHRVEVLINGDAHPLGVFDVTA